MKYVNPMGDGHDTLWSRRTIDTMLKNPVYLGHMVQGKQRVISYKVHKKLRVPEDEWFIVENTHEPIIDQNLFDVVQELMTRNTRQVSSTPSLHLFSGFLRCADCGRSMGRSHIKQYRYFICRKYAESSHKRCTRHSIREDRLYTAVLSAIRAQITLVEDLHQIAEEITRRSHTNNASLNLESLRALRQQDLERIRKMTDELYIDFKSGELSKKEYQRIKKNLNAQEEAMLHVIANLNQELIEAASSIYAPSAYLAAFLKYKNVDQLDRRMLVELIKEIRIHESNEITIVFAFADQHRHIIEFIEDNRRADASQKAGTD